MQDAPIPSADDLRALLAEIAVAHMPYGKYGPDTYPPGWLPAHGFAHRISGLVLAAGMAER